MSRSLIQRDRILMTGGSSGDHIYRAVLAALGRCEGPRDVAIDLGCGRGDFSRLLATHFTKVIAVDVHPFNTDLESGNVTFLQADLNETVWSLSSHEADACFAIETIEHLENPRQFVRSMVRLLKPGGWCFVSTPNQLSLSSKLCLIVRDCFRDFQDSCYPAHISALLGIDLHRISQEAGLADPRLSYTNSGRMPCTSWRWQQFLPVGGKWFSDNVILAARLRVLPTSNDLASELK